MMLRSRVAQTQFRIIDKETKTLIPYDYKKRLTHKQQRFAIAYPDGIWQMTQIIKKEFANKNQAVEIYVDSRVSINDGPYHTFIDPDVDFVTAKWNYFSHNQWIMVPDEYK